MDSNLEDEEISEQKNNNLIEENENDDKLNINKKKDKAEESSRNELIEKKEKSSSHEKEENTKDTKKKESKEEKDEEELKRGKTKKKSTKKSTKKSKQKDVKPVGEDEQKEEGKEEKVKKEGENEEKKEGKENKEGEEKKEEEGEEKIEEKKTVVDKIKYPIIPYKVSDTYQASLLTLLKKENRVRPKYLLEPERDDITRDIKTLDEEEAEQKKLEEIEERNAEEKEREDKIFLNKYKESSLLGNTMLEDPLALFHDCEKVYIDQFYKLSDLFVICPLYFNYRISLEYKTSETEYSAYHLFNTKEISPPCSHNFCSNQAREIEVNIFNFILTPKDTPNTTNRKIQKFVRLRKDCRCAFSCLCSCCSRPTFIVETPVEMLGKVIETRTVCDPVIHIADINNDIIYVLKAKFCDCGFCCRDQCCDNRKCASCLFIIYDGAQENKIGMIAKDHRSGKKTKPDYDQVTITYPPGISCQDKVLIMGAALAIEYLYFQNLSNTKRCSGKPRFLHSYSD